jgi:3-oxoacyl-[acyl-carrier protein] reductase
MARRQLQDKRALVTGASGGIGRALSLELARHGTDLVLVARREDKLAAVAAEIAKLGRRAEIVIGDVTDADARHRAIEVAQEKFGGLDVLVNNAGVLKDRSLRKMTLDDWHAVIQTNLTGVFHCCKYAAEVLRDGGRVVSIASVAGLVGINGQANYAAAKAGVIGMTRSLAKEFARRGITVNAVAPGVVQTPMLGEIKPEVMAEYLKQIPVGRLAQPDDVANVVLFLASEETGYVTGQVIPVTGGWLV